MADEVYKTGYEMTPLQKHVAFFDINRDGLIYPSETFQGFRKLGCGLPLSVFASAFINGFLGPRTNPGKFPNLLFPIYISNIHKGKHGSDSDAFDEEGRFVPEKFQDIFSKHAHTTPDALTKKELKEMLTANREPKNYLGWLGAYVEWRILFYLAKNKDGLLTKETTRALYDGTLFWKMEEEVSSRKKAA